MAFVLKTDLRRVADFPAAGIAGPLAGSFHHVTADAAATVAAANYFNAAAALLVKGSVITSITAITGTPVRTAYIVTANDGTTVTIA
jgi:hypothetical protein